MAGIQLDAPKGEPVFVGERSSGIRATPLAASALVHALVLYVLYAPPMFLSRLPSTAMLGNKGDSVELVYLAQAGDTADASPAEADKAFKPIPFVFPRPVEAESKRRRQSRKPPKPGSAGEVARAGTPKGSLLYGSAFGPEVRPALPIQSVDPDFRTLNVPAGVRGNVVARVRIDAQGKVVDVVLITGLGHGIDEQVLEALLLWRYRPATLDGVPVPEQHMVVVPFPQ